MVRLLDHQRVRRQARSADPEAEQKTGPSARSVEPPVSVAVDTTHPSPPPAKQENRGDRLWVKCPRCQELIFVKQHEDALRVCPSCRHHLRMNARERVMAVLDAGSFAEFDPGLRSADPLSFVSGGQSYAEKLAEYSRQTGISEGFVYGTGTIDGQEVVIGASDFRFCGGAMGAAYGEKVMRAIQLAERRAVPLILFSNGGGARMQEGAISLLQLAKTLAALNQFKEAGLPYFSVMIDPCLGGITASYAMLGDVNIAEPEAYIGFAGRRVIEQTMRQKLPKDAATAEFLQRHGMVDMVVDRRQIRLTLMQLIRLYVTCNPRAREKVLNAPRT